VVIEPLDWTATTGSLRIVPEKMLPLEAAVVAQLACRFQFRGPWVITAVAAPRL
jgi:hypothetical protein